MLSFRRLCGPVMTAGLALASIAVACFGQEKAAPVLPVLENYRPVTAERLKNPEDGNWLMNRRTYHWAGYSPLDQITPQNVERLRPVWGFDGRDEGARSGAPC